MQIDAIFRARNHNSWTPVTINFPQSRKMCLATHGPNVVNPAGFSTRALRFLSRRLMRLFPIEEMDYNWLPKILKYFIEYIEIIDEK